MPDTLQQLFAFLEASPSPFHAVAHAAAHLEAAGYTRLAEAEPWALAPGRGYYVTRNGSSVLAWRVPAQGLAGWRIAASHCDSPTWRVKGTGTVEAQGLARLNVEGYGGMLMATWFDRPLTVAGRAIVRTGSGLESRPVYLDRDLLVIPSLASHFDPSANSGHSYDPARELQPVWGPEGCRPPAELLAEALGVQADAIVDCDLVLAVRQAPTRLAPDGELYLAPRIDDLACAATTLQAFLTSAAEAPQGYAPLWVMLDTEEIGSSTRQGAASTFVRDTLARIHEACGCPGAEAMARILADSFCLSADNAHATHPAHPEVADPACPVRLGGGVVLKFSARQSYSTTGLSGAVFREICRRNAVPVQVFANRAGQRGGGTLGHLLAQTVPVPIADIGLPQLAMHAAVETAAAADADAMVRAVSAFYRADLHAAADGVYRL